MGYIAVSGANVTPATTDPSGRVTTHGYDAAGQLISVKYSSTSTKAVSDTYNGAGARMSMTDDTETTKWTYDSLGRNTSHTAAGTVSYGYDVRGNVTKVTYPNAKAVIRTFGSDGEMTSVTDWNALRLHSLTTKTSISSPPLRPTALLKG